MTMKTWPGLLAATVLVALGGPAWANKGEELIASAKCSKCHTATTTKKGPSFADLAKKAKGDAAAANRMFDTLKTGGKEDHDKLAASDADIRAVVAVVLSK